MGALAALHALQECVFATAFFFGPRNYVMCAVRRGCALVVRALHCGAHGNCDTARDAAFGKQQAAAEAPAAAAQRQQRQRVRLVVACVIAGARAVQRALLDSSGSDDSSDYCGDAGRSLRGKRTN